MSQSHAFSKFMYGGQTSAYDVAATRTSELSRVQSGNIAVNNGTIIEYGVGEGLNAVKSYYGPYDVSLRANFNVNDFDFFKYFIGPKTGSGTAGSPYTYTEATNVELSTSNLQPFTMELFNDTSGTDDPHIAIGCIGNSFTISGEVGGIINADTEIFACKDNRPSTATSYTPVTEQSYLMLGGTWKLGSSPTTLTGVRSFSLTHTYNMNPSEYRDGDSRFIQKPNLPTRALSGSCTVVVNKSQADTIYADFYGQAVTSGPVEGTTDPAFTDGLEFTVDLLSGSKVAQVSYDDVSIDSIDKGVSLGGGIVLMTFNFTARKGTNNTPIKEWSV